MLIELLREAATTSSEQALLAAPGRTLTYAECLARSEALARGLVGASVDRFAAVVEDPADVLTLLSAASATGSEPCIYPADLDDAEVERYAGAFGHHTVVTSRAMSLTGPRVVDLDGLATGNGIETGRGPAPTPPDRAPILILTTGTTGDPKAARHDLRTLVSGIRPQPRPGSRWLLTYNLNQFAGVQVLIHVLASRATLVVPGSLRPADVLAAMTELGVTHVSSTPTWWRFLRSAINESLAGRIPLEQITLGGEAVPAALLSDLLTLFPSARISQVYASTEFGTAVSVGDRQAGLPISVLERDEDAAVRFRVVDGELHVRSRVGMLGYHGEPDVDDGWRPTGDLVEVRGDRIHFTGRASNTINVGGVKVAPLPVEELVGAIEGVEVAKAYGRPNPVTGEIVAVDVLARPGTDALLLEEQIRAACSTLPPAARPRSIRFVEHIDVQQQKISRRR